MRNDILLSWSGGKDSSLALFELVRSKKYDVRALLTTVTEGYDRISMHGVRRSLLSAQALSVGFPLNEVWIPKSASNQAYDDRMKAVLTGYKKSGVGLVAFGDLFLQDIRWYRDERLARVGMKGVYPLWGRDTSKLAREFVDDGFRAIVCCLDPKKMPAEFCGAEYDTAFLDSIPSAVDPCGENGEFHTFVYDGPIFSHGIPIRKGEVVLRDGFYFADILPGVPRGKDNL
jgi:uncharacterized protein (TIGR00290 family)